MVPTKVLSSFINFRIATDIAINVVSRCSKKAMRYVMRLFTVSSSSK